MKRLFVFLGVALFLASNAAFAEQDTLIDFSKLTEEGDLKLNPQTTIDYSRQAGTQYSAEDKAKMLISLAIPSWEIKLASSAQTVENVGLSWIRTSPVKENASHYGGQNVMGVRVHFPSYAINSYAMIQPPFKIPAYSTRQNAADQTQAKPGAQFDGIGILKNVGVIKAVQLNVLGRNSNNSISLLLENEDGIQRQLFMGYLNFGGWSSLTWNNPEYITDVRNRNLKSVALYPRNPSYIKLIAIIVHRDANQVADGNDVVFYLKDIKVIYDKDVVGLNDDVDDESIWQINKEKADKVANNELQRLGTLQVLRSLENKKIAQETGFGDPAATETPTATLPTTPATNP